MAVPPSPGVVRRQDRTAGAACQRPLPPHFPTPPASGAGSARSLRASVSRSAGWSAPPRPAQPLRPACRVDTSSLLVHAHMPARRGVWRYWKFSTTVSLSVRQHAAVLRRSRAQCLARRRPAGMSMRSNARSCAADARGRRRERLVQYSQRPEAAHHVRPRSAVGIPGHSPRRRIVAAVTIGQADVEDDRIEMRIFAGRTLRASISGRGSRRIRWFRQVSATRIAQWSHRPRDQSRSPN